MKKRNPYEIIISPYLEPIQSEGFSAPKYADIKCENLSIRAHQQIEFNGCVFERCKFIGDFRKAQFIDCVLSSCDLSNADFESSRFHFYSGSISIDRMGVLGTSGCRFESCLPDKRCRKIVFWCNAYPFFLVRYHANRLRRTCDA